MKAVQKFVDHTDVILFLLSKDNRNYDRMAFILIDSIIENIITEAVDFSLWFEERLVARIEDMPDDQRNRLEAELEKIRAHPMLTTKRIRNIRGYFFEKLKYLSSDLKRYEPSIATIANHLHNYRNDMYHHGIDHQSNVASAARVYLKILCELFLSLSGGVTIESDQNYAPIIERFGYSSVYEITENRKKIVDDVISRVALSLKELSSNMIAHLRELLEEIDDALDFINENTSFADSIEETFERLSAFTDNPESAHQVMNRKKDDKRNQKQYDVLRRFREEIPLIETKENELTMFQLFAELESQIAPLRKLFIEVSSEIDSSIQVQIDLARGK
ncbi:MAG: hypothetical protein J7K04_15975 [Spirochaetales bacterium]|nr:hypothetical protein [Spirochaetales bacterium]